MNNSRDLHVMISFDMETDIGSWTTTHEGVAKGTTPILEVLERHGIKSTFLFTGDAATQHPESVRLTRDAGHEIGCHTLQHESMGDPLSDIPPRPVLPEEVENRLTKATDLIERIAGVRPVSFRAPRGWASNEMIRALDGLGYLVDSSCMTWYHRDRFLPYHPSADDWRREGDMNILEIPLFSDPVAAGGESASRNVDQWPVLRTRGGEALAEMILRVAAALWDRKQHAVACVYLHPWEFVEMPHTYDCGEARIEFADILWRNTGDFAIRALDEMIRRLASAGARFHTLEGFRDTWVAEKL